MDFTSLRVVIRHLVRDLHDQRDQQDEQDPLALRRPWHATDTFWELPPAQRASVLALARHLHQAHGDIRALVPSQGLNEWC